METENKTLVDIVTKIANDKLNMDTLETFGNDSLDFHDLHAGMIKNALIAAYEAGVAAASK